MATILQQAFQNGLTELSFTIYQKLNSNRMMQTCYRQLVLVLPA